MNEETHGVDIVIRFVLHSGSDPLFQKREDNGSKVVSNHVKFLVSEYKISSGFGTVNFQGSVDVLFQKTVQ